MDGGQLGWLPKGEALIWDAVTGQKVFSLEGHTSPIRGLAFSPNGERLITGDHDGIVKLWNMKDGIEILTIARYVGGFFDMAFSPHGSYLAGAGFELTLWDGSPLPDS